MCRSAVDSFCKFCDCVNKTVAMGVPKKGVNQVCGDIDKFRPNLFFLDFYCIYYIQK